MKMLILDFLPMQLGDVKETMSDSSKLESWINFRPETEIKTGIKDFVNWFKKLADELKLNYRVFRTSIPNYSLNRFRFSIILKKCKIYST